MTLKYILTKRQVANDLIKILYKNKFNRFHDLIDLKISL